MDDLTRTGLINDLKEKAKKAENILAHYIAVAEIVSTDIDQGRDKDMIRAGIYLRELLLLYLDEAFDNVMLAGAEIGDIIFDPVKLKDEADDTDAEQA